MGHRKGVDPVRSFLRGVGASGQPAEQPSGRAVRSRGHREERSGNYPQAGEVTDFLHFSMYAGWGAKISEVFSSGELTVDRVARINRINDGGAAAGDEILRPPLPREALKKGLANGIEKVLKVDSFGETEGTCQVVWGLLWARDV